MEYYYAIGRRKRAIVQARLYEKGKGAVKVNDREFENYFPTVELRQIVQAPFVETGTEGKFDLVLRVQGGGPHGQAEAVRLAVSRALLLFNPEFRSSLKKLGFLRRDARIRERKKFGLKGARRAPQWSKR